ncbi:retinoic acid receptor responder protein 1-like [Rhinatrema bivittatum]|uniref:retinoic acid receptor responder protein 1-like n=1 Tax=Rhinatrema bivittatum TaxID=194408 RepID=UPI0011279539|nr:retinoic acid receptor responder protein 1-like [Rhinatrema bivittatum]
MQCRACLLALTFLAAARGSASLPFSAPPAQGSALELVPSHRPAQQAARVAVHYLNYIASSPNKLQKPGEVKQAIRKDIPGVGHKYYIQFTTEDFLSDEKVCVCSATVLFQMKKPRPAISLNCTSNKNQKQAREDDYIFYKEMKQRTEAISGKEIPDSYGHIDPSLEPLWHLAIAGSSYIMWEKSEENLHYNVAQIKSVKQWIRRDDFIDFDYNILLHEIPTQEMVPCQMRIVWHPEQPMKVKYYCLPVPRSEEEEGSGIESKEGSASYGNF